MRYEDVYGKVLTLKDENGRPVKAQVTGYGGDLNRDGVGVTFRLLVSDWALNADNTSERQLRRQGWEVPTFEITNVRQQELRRLAGKLSGKPPEDSLNSMDGIPESAQQIVDRLLKS